MSYGKVRIDHYDDSLALYIFTSKRAPGYQKVSKYLAIRKFQSILISKSPPCYQKVSKQRATRKFISKQILLQNGSWLPERMQCKKIYFKADSPQTRLLATGKFQSNSLRESSVHSRFTSKTAPGNWAGRQLMYVLGFRVQASSSTDWYYSHVHAHSSQQLEPNLI